MATRTKNARLNGNSGAVKPQDLAAATVVLDFRCGAPGFRKRMRSDDVLDSEDVVDRELIHVRKDLIDPAALTEIGQQYSQFKRWLGNRSVSCSMLRGGMTLIPLNLVEEVDLGVRAFKSTRVELVRKLLQRYTELKAEAQQRLGKHFNEADYQAEDRIGQAFTVSARFLGFNVPAALEDLNRELYEREKQRVEAEWTEASSEIRTALRESFAGLIEHMADRLGTDTEGKPRTFRDSTIKQMEDFLNTFAARNLTGDEQLAKLAEQAKDVMKGVSAPADLRKNEITRERVRQGFEEIKQKLDESGMVTRTRKFARDEEV